MNDSQRNEMFEDWRAFQKEFFDLERHQWKPYDDSFHLMEEVERWVDKRNSKNVDLIGCDDSYHSNSDLILFHHIYTKNNEKKCWGTTVLFLSQCAGDPPAEFFLYPGHAKALIDSLQKVWEIRERK